MNQVNIVNILKEKNEKKSFDEYEKKLAYIGFNYVLPLLKERITDDSKGALLYRGLQTFDNNGCPKNNLSKDDKILNRIIASICYALAFTCDLMQASNLKDETIADTLINKELEGMEDKIYKSYNAERDIL